MSLLLVWTTRLSEEAPVAQGDRWLASWSHTRPVRNWTATVGTKVTEDSAGAFHVSSLELAVEHSRKRLGEGVDVGGNRFGAVLSRQTETFYTEQ